jgi:ribose transport system ATP-binding protein
VIVSLRIPSIVVTLASFFGFQGVSLLLRPLPAGPISYGLADFFDARILIIPVVTIFALVSVAGLECMVSRSQLGRAIRASGSDASSARKLGVERKHVVPIVFTMGGFLVGLGGLALAGQVGFGSPTTGVDYSLMSITAVVLGGASIGGGRGSYLATFFGAILVQLTSSATSFLGLGTEWQYWFASGTILIAAVIYSILRYR